MKGSNLLINSDIKPDNVLLDSKGHAHLSDFNIATQLTAQKPYRQNRAGSMIYMAPEILAKKRYSYDVDWWSLGVTTFELLFGRVSTSELSFTVHKNGQFIFIIINNY